MNRRTLLKGIVSAAAVPLGVPVAAPLKMIVRVGLPPCGSRELNAGVKPWPSRSYTVWLDPVTGKETPFKP